MMLPSLPDRDDVRVGKEKPTKTVSRARRRNTTKGSGARHGVVVIDTVFMSVVSWCETSVRGGIVDYYHRSSL